MSTKNTSSPHLSKQRNLVRDHPITHQIDALAFALLHPDFSEPSNNLWSTFYYLSQQI